MKCTLVLPLLCLAFGAWSQTSHICGNEFIQLSEEEQRIASAFYQQDRQGGARSGALDSVAVTVHIIESRGLGGAEISFEEIETELDRANRVYNSAGIHFFICGSPRYVDGGGTYTQSTGDELNRQLHVPTTINIYFVDAIESAPGFATLGFAFFPFFRTPEQRYVMMAKFASTDGATLTHELGHFYGLYHTHHRGFGLEFVNGSNCETAGDMICDTPADPNLLSAGLMSGCTYIGQVVDPNGDFYVPPVNNFMSYASAPCQRFFTDEQFAIVEDVHANQNAYLTGRCDFYPDFAIQPEGEQLEIRSDEDITFEYSFTQRNVERSYDIELRISLAEEEDQTGLLLHKERILLDPGDNSFSKTYDLDFPIELGTGNYFLKAVLDSENEVIERTEKNNLAQANVVVDNSALESLTVFPNPVSNDLRLFIRDQRATGKLDIRIFSYDGRLIYEQEGFKSTEEYFKLLDVSSFEKGIYVISVDFENVEAEYSFKFFKH